MDAQEVANIIAATISAGTEDESLVEELGSIVGERDCYSIRSFEEAGLLTSDDGIVFDDPSGNRVCITVRVEPGY